MDCTWSLSTLSQHCTSRGGVIWLLAISPFLNYFHWPLIIIGCCRSAIFRTMFAFRRQRCCSLQDVKQERELDFRFPEMICASAAHLSSYSWEENIVFSYIKMSNFVSKKHSQKSQQAVSEGSSLWNSSKHSRNINDSNDQKTQTGKWGTQFLKWEVL